MCFSSVRHQRRATQGIWQRAQLFYRRSSDLLQKSHAISMTESMKEQFDIPEPEQGTSAF